MKKSIATMEIIIVLLGLNLINFGTAAPTPKCTQVKVGYYYDGLTSPRIDGINAYGDCQNLCENNATCYGWQYQGSSNSCWLQTSISTLFTEASYTGGACIGPYAKVACTENIANMYYNGDSGSAITGITSASACMKQCDGISTCLGWSFSSSESKCWPQTTVYGSVSNPSYSGGSCIKKQQPYPAITIADFRKQQVTAHNECRRKHGADDLKLDDELNTAAQQYAETIAAKDVLEHSTNRTYHGENTGENIYTVSGLTQPMYSPGKDAVTTWYDENSVYNWAEPGFGPSTGHFTQAVWKGSTLLGVGRALAKGSNTLYVVARYYPAGNMEGGYQTNVLQAS